MAAPGLARLSWSPLGFLGAELLLLLAPVWVVEVMGGAEVGLAGARAARALLEHRPLALKTGACTAVLVRGCVTFNPGAGPTCYDGLFEELLLQVGQEADDPLPGDLPQV